MKEWLAKIGKRKEKFVDIERVLLRARIETMELGREINLIGHWALEGNM